MLNRLHRLLPEGLLADTAWFNRLGYSSSLRSRYVASNWLQEVTKGVFRRPLYKSGLQNEEAAGNWQHTLLALQDWQPVEQVPVNWQSVVLSMQMILKRAIVVGGRTALELLGFSHYTSGSGPREIHLYSDEPAPTWLKRLPLKTTFVCHNARRLFRAEPIAKGFETLDAVMASDESPVHSPIHGSLTWIDIGNWDWPLVLSTPERAILELLDELPEKETFHQADVLMAGLTNLSPKRLNRLLRECRSIKVKRLFLWFTDRHRHAWRTQLDRNHIDLGTGKRMLARGGKFDPKYQITIPEDLDAGG